MDGFLDVKIAFYLASAKKVLPSSPTILIASVASMLMSTLLSMKALMTSSTLTIVKSAQKLVLGSPKSSTNLPAYQINWLNYNNIRCKLVKYTKEEGRSESIEEDLLSLLSKFLTSVIKFNLLVRKNKLIELFSQLILNDMSIWGNSTKSAEWYV